MTCELQRVPDYFLRKFGGELSTFANLSVPDGSVWRISLKKADNKVWLHDGWKEFVQRYSISIGCFLVFKYEGNSSFNVHIFNLAVSEINYRLGNRNNDEQPYFTNQHIFEDMEDEDFFDYSDSARSHLTPCAFSNKVITGSSDQLTSGKNYTPPFQNLFNGSKLNSINWGDTISSKGANSQTNQLTRDKGVQFNAAEFKRSTEELKLRGSNSEMQRVKKTVRKRRKTDPSKL